MACACEKEEVNPRPNPNTGTVTTTQGTNGQGTTSPILGCMQVNACNYSPNATQNDGSCYFCSDCSGNTLENTYLHQTRDYNVLDQNVNSPYYNTVFSTLTINWYREDYCTSLINNFFINFKNTTNHTITFDYHIESNADGNIRSAQGIVQSLAPGQIFEKEEGISAFWNLANYPVTVTVNNVDYN